MDHHDLGQFLICETIQYCGFLTQVSKFYENPSCVSCFFIKILSYASTILRRIHDPLPPIVVDGGLEYEVEDILDSMISNHQLQYFVHWHGYDVSKCTWELIKNLSNVMQEVHKFHQQYLNKPMSIFHGIRH